jgi:hypothetical protein
MEPPPKEERRKRKASSQDEFEIKEELEDEFVSVSDSPVHSDSSTYDGEYDADDSLRPGKKFKTTARSAIARLAAKGGNVYRFKTYLSFKFQGTIIWYGVHQKQPYYSSNLVLSAASGKPWKADTKKFLAVRILNCNEDPVFHYGISPKNGQESIVLSVPQVMTVLGSMLQRKRTRENYPMATALMQKILHHKIEEDAEFVEEEETPVTRKVYRKDYNAAKPRRYKKKDDEYDDDDEDDEEDIDFDEDQSMFTIYICTNLNRRRPKRSGPQP